MQPDTPNHSRRRVLWLSHLLPWPPKGGLRQRSYHLMKAIGERHELEVIAFRQRSQQPDAESVDAALGALEQFAVVRRVIDLPQEDYPIGQVGLAARSLLPGEPFTVRWGKSMAYREAVREAVSQSDPELVHVDTISLAPYIAEVADDLPACLNHHNVESEMLLRRASQEPNMLRRVYFWQEGRRLQAVERSFAGRFWRHLVCAELDAERLKAVVPGVHTEVVPNGVDLDYFTASPADTPETPDSLIFVGGLSWYPNASAMQFLVSDVWPLLVERRPEARLQIIGRNPSVSLRRLAAPYAGIEIPGFVDDMRPLVYRSQVYVCPIYDGGGTKLKMIDAMALSKPIVAHPVACEGLGLTDGVDVIIAETPIEFRDSIIRLFEDSELRRRLGAAARARAERVFSFREIGAKLADLYSQLAASR